MKNIFFKYFACILILQCLFSSVFIFKYLFQNDLIFNFVLPVSAATILFTGYLFFQIVKTIFHRSKTIAEAKSMQEQKKLHQQKAAELEERKQQLLVMQKETQDRLEEIYHCLKTGDFSSASKTLKKISSKVYNSQFCPYCQDYLADAVLNSKYQAAAKHHIKVHYMIGLPDKYEFSPTELCTILFNLLDNGIESCKKTDFSNPFINLTIKTKSDFLIIHMKNSKQKREVFSRRSSKEDSMEHGFGISIIEEIAARHDGFCQWTDSGDTFDSSVMLRFRSFSSIQ